MDMEEAFVAEIRANPRDDIPRLVYADYLEESGSARGELIRVQCELAGTGRSGRSRAELQQREQELLERNGERWLEPVRNLGAEGVDIRCFRRGLIERVRIPAERLPAVAEELCQVEPALHCLQLRGLADVVDEVAACAIPGQITELELGSNRLEAEHIRELVHADWRSHIRHLDLSFNRLLDPGVAALTEQEWPALLRLDLDSNRIREAGAQALAGWETCRHLEILSLNLNRIGSGLESLAQSPLFSELRRLELVSNDIQSATDLAEAPWLETIEGLLLRNNPLGANELTKLAQGSRPTPYLRELDVRNTVSIRPGYYDDRAAFPRALKARFGKAVVADFPLEPPENSTSGDDA